MENNQVLIDQMISKIIVQIAKLDEVRLRMFLGWLKAHSNQMNVVLQNMILLNTPTQHNEVINLYLKNGLKIWFEALATPILLWEYDLIISEITWWHQLNQSALKIILKNKRET